MRKETTARRIAGDETCGSCELPGEKNANSEAASARAIRDERVGIPLPCRFALALRRQAYEFVELIEPEQSRQACLARSGAPDRREQLAQCLRDRVRGRDRKHDDGVAERLQFLRRKQWREAGGYRRKPRGFGESRAERVVHAGHDQDFGGRDQFTQAGRATKRASPP